MRWVRGLCWTVALLGCGAVTWGGYLMVYRNVFDAALWLMFLGLGLIIVSMGVVSFVSRHQGLGVIY